MLERLEQVMTGMNNRYPLAILLLSVILLSGCKSAPTKQPEQAQQAPENPLFYNTLIAEIAGHRGNLKESVKYYQQVIESTDDLNIIRRASRIMLFAKDYQAANQAVKRWPELSPNDMEARQVAATTNLYQGDIDGAVVSLEWMLEYAKDEQRGFKLLAALLERLPANKLQQVPWEKWQLVTRQLLKRRSFMHDLPMHQSNTINQWKLRPKPSS